MDEKEKINKKTEPEEFEKIFETCNAGDIAFIKSLLDANRIDYIVEGENFNQVRPLVQPAVFKVNKKQLSDAAELLKNFKGGIFGQGAV